MTTNGIFHLYEVNESGLGSIIFSGTEESVRHYPIRNAPPQNFLYRDGNYAILQDGFTVDMKGWLTKIIDQKSLPA